MVGRRQARKTPADVQGVSPLRQARLAIPATLEQACEDLDKQSNQGSSGVTPSMLSGWERGVHITSIKYRKMLADYYGQLHEAMTEVVRDARQYLAVVGSRSRDAVYLETIETVLAERPELVHYRVLFGPPRRQVLKDHLLRLVTIRDPHDRSLGLKTLHIGIVEDDPGTPERFFCASESAAVVPIPSLTSAEAFDSGVLFESGVGERLIDHARQCYAGARRVETEQALRDLPIVRS